MELRHSEAHHSSSILQNMELRHSEAHHSSSILQTIAEYRTHSRSEFKSTAQNHHQAHDTGDAHKWNAEVCRTWYVELSRGETDRSAKLSRGETDGSGEQLRPDVRRSWCHCASLQCHISAVPLHMFRRVSRVRQQDWYYFLYSPSVPIFTAILLYTTW